MEWSRAKANRVLPREHTGHSRHPLPTTQEKTLHLDIPDGQHRNQIDSVLCSQRWRSSIQSVKTRQGADCGSDHELLIAKFRLKLKEIGKTTRPFRYDLNQIPYDYTVEVRNGFKGLDLIDRVPDELWTEVCDIVQEFGYQGLKAIWRKKIHVDQVDIVQTEMKSKLSPKDPASLWPLISTRALCLLFFQFSFFYLQFSKVFVDLAFLIYPKM